MATTDLIDRPYGTDLDTMAATIARVVEDYFIDSDGLVLACINARTNAPFTDDDAEVRDMVFHKAWFANGSFPYEVKRTALNYEDADMTMGELLMAYLARARVAPSLAHTAAVERLAGAMLHLNQVVAERNPFGPGFLPKPHGGLRYVHECFEMSADQYLKWAVALEAYGRFTADAERRARVDAVLRAMGEWLDARDFATPYMGNTNYARLNPLRHYHLTFAYLCALGHRLGGDVHLMDEVAFFKDRALSASRDSTAPNSQNLVIEATARLLELAPEHSDAWLGLMRRDWDAGRRFVLPDYRIRFSDHFWNHATRYAVNYLVARQYLPDIEGSVDVEAILLAHDTKQKFVHLVAGQEMTGPFADGRYPHYDTHLLGLAYASWLRAYWETRA